MLYVIFTTGQCNLRCRYCGGSFPSNRVAWIVEYPLDQLRSFVSDDMDPIIAFYGGEPLLNIDFIKEVMDGLPHCKFVIQSNGTLTNNLEHDYWLRFDAVLLSIDGRRTVTNYYRDAGVYEAVVDSAKWLRSIGFKNDLIARMTVSELSNIYLDVRHLLSLNLFDHIHWQLDVIWSSRWKGFPEWCERSYIPGISRLVQLWIREARKGKVLGLVPFISIIGTMVMNKRVSCPPCEAGVGSVAISTDGEVLACPIAVDAGWARLGNISRDSRTQVVGKVRIGEPCISCKFLRYCGGRCLYAHYERFWGEDGFKRVCELTIHMINKLAGIKDEVSHLLDKGVISIDQLNYPPFNNTTEIIP